MKKNKKNLLSSTAKIIIIILTYFHSQIIFASQNSRIKNKEFHIKEFINLKQRTRTQDRQIKALLKKTTKLETTVLTLKDKFFELQTNQDIHTQLDETQRSLDESLQNLFIFCGLLKKINNPNFDPTQNQSRENSPEILEPQWADSHDYKKLSIQIKALEEHVIRLSNIIYNDYVNKKDLIAALVQQKNFIERLRDHFIANYVTEKKLQDHLKILHDNFTSEQALALAIDTIKKNMH